jgi:hypothetical protein
MKKSKHIIEESSDSEELEGSSKSEGGEPEEFDQKTFRKTLAKMFPSKYISKKVEKDKQDKKNSKESEDSKPDKKKKQKETKELKNTKKGKKKAKSDSESEDDNHSELESDASGSMDEDDYSTDEDSKRKTSKNKVNIVFSISGGSRADDYDDEYDDYDEEYDEDTEDEECNSEDEETFMKETYKKLEMPKEPVEPPAKSKKSKSGEPESGESKKSEKIDEADVQTEYIELQELRKQLTEKLHKKPNSKILKNAIAECKKAICELVKTARSKNTKSYYKLVHKDRERTDEMNYFKKHLSNKEQMRIMKEMKEINDHIHIEKPYRLALLQSNIPAKYMLLAMK